MCHKTRLRGGKNCTPIFLASLTPKKVKKTIKSILARTFNFGHISDIPHQTNTASPVWQSEQTRKIAQANNYFVGRQNVIGYHD